MASKTWAACFDGMPAPLSKIVTARAAWSNSIETFDSGQSDLWDAHTDLLDRHEKLLKDWNKFVGQYNAMVAPKDLGRPMAASEAQAKDVQRRRKEGESLRQIASGTGLSFATVRTIVGKVEGTDRTTKRQNLLRKREFDRLRAADFRARKKGRDALPKQVTEHQRRSEALIREAKGLGKGL